MMGIAGSPSPRLGCFFLVGIMITFLTADFCWRMASTPACGHGHPVGKDISVKRCQALTLFGWWDSETSCGAAMLNIQWLQWLQGGMGSLDLMWPWTSTSRSIYITLIRSHLRSHICFFSSPPIQCPSGRYRLILESFSYISAWYWYIYILIAVYDKWWHLIRHHVPSCPIHKLRATVRPRRQMIPEAVKDLWHKARQDAEHILRMGRRIDGWDYQIHQWDPEG